MKAFYETRMAAIRKRLRDALAPQTPDEETVLEWLGMWDPGTLEPLANMAERLQRAGTAGAYDRGYREATEYLMQRRSA